MLMHLHHIKEVASSHPLLRGLLRDWPPAYSIWTKEQQQCWLELATSIFAVLYEKEPDSELKPPVSRLSSVPLLSLDRSVVLSRDEDGYLGPTLRNQYRYP